MGIGAWWHWLVVLLIVVLVFGTKKLRNLGGDVGGAVKDFKDAMNAGKNGTDVTSKQSVTSVDSMLIDAKALEVPEEKPAPKKRAPAKKPAAAKVTASKSSATKTVAKPKATVKKATAKPKATATKKSNAE